MRRCSGSPQTGPGIYAFSRISAGQNLEYVVAANSADAPADGHLPDVLRNMHFGRVRPAGPPEPGNNAIGVPTVKSDADGQVTLAVRPAR